MIWAVLAINLLVVEVTLSMSKEIIIECGKSLKLNNIISREIPVQDNDEIQRIMHMFNSYMKTKGLTPYGPMIILNSSLIENNTIIPVSKIMIQIREEPESLEPPYVFDGTIKLSNCILARYRGDLFNLQMAYSKIQVYAFENELELKDEIYSIFVKQDLSEITVDIFVEIIS